MNCLTSDAKKGFHLRGECRRRSHDRRADNSSTGSTRVKFFREQRASPLTARAFSASFLPRSRDRFPPRLSRFTSFSPLSAGLFAAARHTSARAKKKGRSSKVGKSRGKVENAEVKREEIKVGERKPAGWDKKSKNG